MKLFKRRFLEPELRCSFCHKDQDVVGKLISSPSDYPVAHICDECILVCSSILKDDSAAGRFPVTHPLEPEFFRLVKEWVALETNKQDPNPTLDRMYVMALRMFEDIDGEAVDVEY